MATSFEFATAARIVFGQGTSDSLGETAASLGRRAFVVVGSRTVEHVGVVVALRTVQ